MDFPKKQAQRLMPLYLLEYSEKLFTNHPDPSAPWGGGGGGSDYTAGQGITITNNEISVDTNVIATKSDIPDFTKYYYVNNVIEDGEYFTKINSSGLEYFSGWNPNSISINVKNAELENNASIVVQNIGGNEIAISNRIDVYNHGSNTGVSVEGDKVAIHAQNGHTTSLMDGKLIYEDGQVREFNLPITKDPRTYTLATEEWVQNQRYSTFSGSYNDLTDKPTIPDTSNLVTLDTEQTITGLKTIGETSGTISEVDFSGFTFKLSNKAINHPEADIKIRNASYDGYQYPTIYSTKGLYVNLAKIKLGDDGNNTYGIKMPDSSTWEADRVLATTDDIPDTSNFVTTDTNQRIEGLKKFASGRLQIESIGTEFPARSSLAFGSNAFRFATTNNVTQFNLPISKPSGTPDQPAEYTLATIDDIPTIPVLATVATTGSYNDLIDKPTIPTVNNPTITFTQGGTTKGTITLNQSGDQTIEFDAGSSLPDSPFLNVNDPNDQMFFSLDGSDSSWYKYVDLSATPNRMFHVNLSALNPVFKDGLTSTYNEQTNQLEVSLNAVIPTKTSDLFNDSGYVTSSEVPSSATSTSTSTVTPTTGTFVTGTSTNTTNVVNSVTYTPSSETLTFTYADNTTASFTFLTSNTTVTSGTTSVVSSVTDSTSNAMTGATVSTSTTTTLS